MKIRQLHFADLPFAWNCIQSVGWNGEDATALNTLYEYDADGCFLLEHQGVPAGICIAIKYAHSAFIGDLIILDKFRGRGFGHALFQQAVDYLDSSGVQSIYLDAALKAVPIYQRCGFRTIDKSLRFAGKVRGQNTSQVRHMQASDLPAVIAGDRKYFGDDRSFFLQRLFERYPQYALVAESDSKLSGFLFAHPGIDILTVGPWLSWGTCNPLPLLENLAIYEPTINFRIGALAGHKETVAMLRSIPGFVERNHCLRMLRGNDTKTAIHANLISIGSGAKG